MLVYQRVIIWIHMGYDVIPSCHVRGMSMPCRWTRWLAGAAGCTESRPGAVQNPGLGGNLSVTLSMDWFKGKFTGKSHI